MIIVVIRKNTRLLYQQTGVFLLFFQIFIGR